MRPLLRLLAIVAVILLGAPPSAASAEPVSGGQDADYVVILGAAGLRWDDISETATPTLWKLASEGAIGSLSVRSGHSPTCPGDGWLTLGAGNYAEYTTVPTVNECPPMEVTIDRPDDIGAQLPDQAKVVAHQRDLPFGAIPGALSESVRCATAVGPGAAIAAARPFGRVDRYEPILPENPTELLSKCVLSIVDLGSVLAEEPAQRAEQVKGVDAMVARVLSARPENSTIIVAGLSDTDRTGRLHVAIVDGPGWQGAWLTSASTGRAGYLQLIDLAPTALEILGRTIPKKIISGYPATSATGRPADLARAAAAGADADRQAAAARRVAGWFFGILAAVQILLYVAVVPLLRSSYRHAGPTGPLPPPQRIVSKLEALLIAAALAVPASLLADLVPWWRSGQRGLIFTAVTLAIIAVLTYGVLRLPSYAKTLTPLAVVAAIAAGTICVDLLTGSTLQLNGVAGYSALEGGRTQGLGIVPMGAFIAGALMLAGCLAQMVRQRRRTLLIAVVGGIGVVLVGSPYFGADAGGALAMTAGVCLAAALATGGWFNFGRLAWATLAGIVVTVVFALIDVNRPVGSQGSLGRFLTQLGNGTSSLTLHRVGWSNMVAFTTSPLSLLAIVSALFLWSVLLRPWGGLKRLHGIYPAVHAAGIGITVAALIAGPMGGAALKVAGAAAATVLPVLTLSALRVLGHAADRTRAAEELGAVPGVTSDTREPLSPV